MMHGPINIRFINSMTSITKTRTVNRIASLSNYFGMSLSLHHAFCSLFKQHTNKCTYIVSNNLKFTLKHLNRSYMFRSYEHPQGAYFDPC